MTYDFKIDSIVKVSVPPEEVAHAMCQAMCEAAGAGDEPKLMEQDYLPRIINALINGLLGGTIQSMQDTIQDNDELAAAVYNLLTLTRMGVNGAILHQIEKFEQTKKK